MTTHPIQLIALDLDGTLVRPDQTCSERNTAAIHAAQQRGIRVIIATGKTAYAARLPREEVGLPHYGVYVQGLDVVGVNGEKLSHAQLAHEFALEMQNLALQMGLDIIYYATDGFLYSPVLSERALRLNKYGEPPLRELPSLQAIQVYKLLLVGEAEDIQQMRPIVETQVAGRATIVQALDDMLEILPSGISKGDGLAILLAHLGIDWQNVMAVGDGENDREMLERAGFGVAMGNAHPVAAATARYHTASNAEDGVAQAIERFALEMPQME